MTGTEVTVTENEEVAVTETMTVTGPEEATGTENEEMTVTGTEEVTVAESGMTSVRRHCHCPTCHVASAGGRQGRRRR